MHKHKKIINAALISSAVLFTTWGINKLIFKASGIKDTLFCENSYTYAWRFGNIFYTRKGSGAPLLLIHDLKSTGSAAEWKSVSDKLAQSHTVYTLDLIGCGRSDKPKMTYTAYNYVQLINDFIKEVIGSKADVIASGSSSSFTILGCYSEPDYYNHILLVNPLSMKEIALYPKANHKTLKCLLEMPLIGTTIYNTVHSRSSIRFELKKNTVNSNININKLTDTMYESSHIGGPAARYFYASEKSYFTNINMIHALKKINHSMCIIGGERQANICDTLDSYVSCNQSIETEILKNCKAYPHLEQPRAFLNLCSIYLS